MTALQADAATRAVDKLIEQGLLDKFQRYNIAQVIRMEYQPAIERLLGIVSGVEKLEAEWRTENGDYPESKRDCADEIHTLLHTEVK